MRPCFSIKDFCRSLSFSSSLTHVYFLISWCFCLFYLAPLDFGLIVYIDLGKNGLAVKQKRGSCFFLNARKNGPAVKKKRTRFLEFMALLFFRMLGRTGRL